MRNMYIILFVIASYLVPGMLFAETVPAGVNGQLWLSKTPFFAGDTITVFALVYDSSPYRMEGTIELYDATTSIDKKLFVVSANGASTVVSFPWHVTSGEHALRAAIIASALVDVSGKSVMLDRPLFATGTPSLRYFADSDENKNGIADSQEPKPLLSAEGTTSSSTITADIEDVVSSIPEPVKKSALPVIGKIEDLRTSQVQKTNNEIAKTNETLGGSPMDDGWGTLAKDAVNGQVWKTPFDYAKLFLLLIWDLIVSHVVIFYVVLLLLIWKIVRVVLRIFF